MNNHYESLTWLRAIAAFFVVTSHSLRASEVKYASNDEASYFLPLDLLDLGTFGVYLFFALSGCTLYMSSYNKINNYKDIIAFYIKRVMRIWPAFAVSMIIYILFIEVFRSYYISDKKFWIAQFLHEYSFINILQYLSLTFNITGPKGLFIGPYWSLPVEFQYYLLLPFTISLMKLTIIKYLSPIIFGSILYYLYYNPIFQIDRIEVFKMGFVFFGGVFIAAYYQGIKYRISFKFSLTIIILILVLISLIRKSIITIGSNIPFIDDIDNLYGVLAITLVYLALITKKLKKNNAIMNFIHGYGEISYSIYLFHMLFIGIATLISINFEIYGDSKKLFFIYVFSLTTSYTFSKYTYRYIELPFIKLGRKTSSHFSIKNTTKSTTMD